MTRRHPDLSHPEPLLILSSEPLYSLHASAPPQGPAACRGPARDFPIQVARYFGLFVAFPKSEGRIAEGTFDTTTVTSSNAILECYSRLLNWTTFGPIMRATSKGRRCYLLFVFQQAKRGSIVGAFPKRKTERRKQNKNNLFISPILHTVGTSRAGAVHVLSSHRRAYLDGFRLQRDMFFLHDGRPRMCSRSWSDEQIPLSRFRPSTYPCHWPSRKETHE